MADARGSFLSVLSKVEPGIADSFQQVMQDLRATADGKRIERAIREALRTGQTDRAVREIMAAMNLDPEFFGPLDRAVTEAYNAGVEYQGESLPGPGTTGLHIRFNARHPRAEAWAREKAAEKVRVYTIEIEENIRATIVEAMEQNSGYQAVRQRLLGTRIGSRWEGGQIGLTAQQGQYVRNAAEELRNLDPAYLKRMRRNRWFDKAIRKAMKDGKPLTEAKITQITNAYSDRLLRLRAQTIARTEGNRAMNAGRHEQMEQLVENGRVPPEAITIIWDATPDERTRLSHMALNGEEIKWGQKFQSPITGFLLRHPHDENAPGEETINCRCTARYRINWAMVRRERQREAA